MTNNDSQNPKQRRTDDALERAMLIDRIARLERQLETAEGRVRNAEQNAKDAKSALAGTLIDKARHQKSGQATTKKGSPAKQDQQPAVPDDVENMERALRAEYEERFQAARDRLGRDFQQRLIDAQAAWKAEAAQRALEERSSRPRPVPARDVANIEILPGTRSDTSHRAPRPALTPRRRNPLLRPSTAIVLALAVTAGAAIVVARGTFRAAKSPSPPAPASAAVSVPAPSPAKAASPSPALTAAAPPPATAPASQPPAAVAEPAPAPAVDGTVMKQPAERTDSAPTPSKTAAVSPTAPANTVNPATAAAPATPPPTASDKAITADSVATTGKATEPASVQSSDAIDAQRKVLEHDAALTAKLDALRKRLDTATRRADVAETALRAERKKAAEEATKLRSMASKAASAKQDTAPPQPLFPPPRFGVVE
jgi:hypothetical protein